MNNKDLNKEVNIDPIVGLPLATMCPAVGVIMIIMAHRDGGGSPTRGPHRVAALRPDLVSLPVGFMAAVKLEKAVGAQATTTLVLSRMGDQAERS